MFCPKDRKVKRMTLNKRLAAVSTALILSFGTMAAQAQDAEPLPARVTDFVRTVAADDHVIGSEDAAITLIIWASVTCPHCGQWFSEDWPVVKKELVETGKLRVAFRAFPTEPAELAMTGFRIAECAPVEDYMSVIEYQMENQKEIFDAAREGRAQDIYSDIAKLAGMETNEAITTCFRNPDITTHIVDNAMRAQVAEIKGVPAFLINGETYKGAQDAKSLVELITKMDKDGLSALPEDIKSNDAHAGHDHE